MAYFSRHGLTRDASSAQVLLNFPGMGPSTTSAPKDNYTLRSYSETWGRRDPGFGRANAPFCVAAEIEYGYYLWALCKLLGAV